ncbi:Rho termination factor N-terminal domain-containing protein [Yinghuangia sp. YIM S09857]|uniref:Rho termination factor N-terminal domain-containing protein n=1 Tax=Yinghuangia sp. YIM S09857 TaxID=3436929 RepID=UPI003F52F618
MLTLYAGPDRVVQAGAVAEFDDDEAAALIAGGFAVAVDAERAPRPRPLSVDVDDPEVAARVAELGKMTIPQLKDYADERDISLPPDGKKADLVAALLAADAEAASPPEG